MTKPAFIDLLDQNGPIFTRLIISQVQGEEDEIWLPNIDEPYQKQEVITGLENWAKRRFPETFNLRYFESKSYSSDHFLKELFSALNTQAQEETLYGNVPSPEKLKALEESLKDHEDWLERIQGVKTQGPTLDKLEALDLENQIKFIQTYQDQIKKTAQELLKDKLSKLSDEDKDKVLERLSQALTKEAALKKEILNSDEIKKNIDLIHQQELETSLNLNETEKEALVRGLSQNLNHPDKQKEVKELTLAWQKINQAKVLLAPTRNELKTTIQNKLGFSPKEANNFLMALESNWPLKTPVQGKEIDDLVEKSLRVLPFSQAVKLERQKVSPLEVASKFGLLLEGYYQSLPLSQTDKSFPISKVALKIAKKLAGRFNPLIIENWLRGFTPEKINLEKEKTIEGSLQNKQLNNLALETEKFEKQADNLPLLLKWSIRGIKRKYKKSVFSFFKIPFSKIPKLNVFSKAFNALALRPRYRIGNFIRNRGQKLSLKGTGLLISVGKGSFKNKVAGRVLRSFGSVLGVVGFVTSAKNVSGAIRSVAIKGVASLIGAVLGLKDAGISTIASVLSFFSTVARFAKSPEGKEFFKKIRDNALAGVTRLAMFIFGNPVTAIGASLGMTVGGFIGAPLGIAYITIPLGGFIGGYLGSLIDKLFSTTAGVQAEASLGIGTTGLETGAGTPALAGETAAAPIAPSFLNTIPGLSIVVPFGVVAGVTATIIVSNGASFITEKETLADVRSHSQSQYFEVKKDISQTSFSKKQLEGIWDRGDEAEVTYQITITAKEKDITIKVINDKFTAYPANSKLPKPSSSLTLPYNLKAGESTSYSYETTFELSQIDSVISNHLTITADVAGGPNNEQSSDLALITLGDAPIIDCLKLEGPWTANEKNWEIQSMAYLSQWPNFVSLLCSGGDINLTRMSGSSWGGWAKGINEIVIYDLGVSNYYSALYTLAHEAGHLIDYRNDNMRNNEFLTAYAEEGFMPTYPDQSKDGEFEDFAESIALYPVWNLMSFKCCGQIDYPNEFPIHYNFVEKFIYEP